MTLLKKNIASVFKGKESKIDLVLICLFAQGHVLLEDVPGVGKTTLAHCLAASIDAQFQRIQFTPDLLPSDILGVSIFNPKEHLFEFQAGPLFTNILLADEINRATPRTQSSLLEAMNEQQVTLDGKTYPLASPFMVIATQNPYEYEGTYPLPESQLDRFLMRFHLGYPSREEERQILKTSPQLQHKKLQPVLSQSDVVQIQSLIQQIPLQEPILNYLLDLAEKTRQNDKIQLGVSPRGVLALSRAIQARAFLTQRDYVLPDDIKALVLAVWAHRIRLKNASSFRDSEQEEKVLSPLLESVSVPL